MVKLTGYLSSGLRDGVRGSNHPRERAQGRRNRFGLENGLSLQVGCVLGLCRTSRGAAQQHAAAVLA